MRMICFIFFNSSLASVQFSWVWARALVYSSIHFVQEFCFGCELFFFLPSSIAMKTKYTWEGRKKNKNLQLHVNKQLCIHYWCGATKYFVDVNVNSLHMSHYTSFMYRLIYWLSRQKFVSCQPVKLRSSISGPFRLKCNRQRCAVIYTDFYRNINYFEGIKSHKSMSFASMWIYRDFLE